MVETEPRSETTSTARPTRLINSRSAGKEMFLATSFEITGI